MKYANLGLSVWTLSIANQIFFFFAALSRSHKRVTGSVWNSQIMNGQLNPVDSDENSESDKTQRAHFARRRNEMDNSAAANL